MRQFDYPISALYHGVSVENYLMQTHGFSRKIITRLKREPEHILLNGKHIRMVDPLKTGDLLTVILAEEASDIPPNPALSVPVIYEDEDIILFDKPAHMPVHPSIAHYYDTLANFFAYYMESKGLSLVFRPINRLDADTTGLCLVAKNAYVAERLSGNKNSGLDKEYTAILCGEFPQEQGVIHAPIAREPGSIMKRMVSPDGQESTTEYQVLFKKNGYTLVRVHLLTGRTHQIRVHFSHLGYPLAGDDLYGGSLEKIDRQALCCTKLRFCHPVSKQPMEFCINMQDDMKKVLNDRNTAP